MLRTGSMAGIHDLTGMIVDGHGPPAPVGSLLAGTETSAHNSNLFPEGTFIFMLLMKCE